MSSLLLQFDFNYGNLNPNVRDALIAATVLEKTAQIWIDVQSLGNAQMISDEDCAKFYDFFMNKYGQKKS